MSRPGVRIDGPCRSSPVLFCARSVPPPFLVKATSLNHSQLQIAIASPHVFMSHSGESRKRRKVASKPVPVRMNPWLLILVTLGTATGAFLFFRQGDPVAAIGLVGITVTAMIAFKMGIVGILSSLLGIAAAIYLAPSAASFLEPYGNEYFQTTGLANRFLCIAVAGVLISMVVSMLVTAVLGGSISHRSRLAHANHYGGFVLGAAEGVVLVWLVLGGLLSMQLWQRGVEMEHNAIAQSIDQWASRTRQSVLGPIVRDYNPFERIEPLAQTQKFPVAVRELTAPGGVDRLLADPQIRALGNDPAVSNAIKAIRSDPKLAEVIHGGQPVGRDELLHLMNSPSVMQLADNPEFRAQVQRVIESRLNASDPFAPAVPGLPSAAHR